MSIGPMGGAAAAVAGAPLAQASGSETDRVRRETTNQQRQVQAGEQAANAAGIAETDGQEHQATDRDADGRRPWEIPSRPGKKPEDPPSDAPPRASRDATGDCGNQLDLSG